MLKNLLLFALTGISTLSLHAQIPDDENPLCREKCSFTHTINREQNVNFFQYPSMDKYDVKYVKLDIIAEANNRFIQGTSLTRARTVQALDTFITEFKNTMIVDSVFINGVKKNFTRDNDHVQIPLSPAIPTGTMVDALFYYRGTASSNAVFAGTVSSNGLVYTASLSESYQAREWWPAKQFLKDKIDSADIWITTSNTNKAGANGLLKAVVDKPNNKKQYQWSTRYPMAYYLLSFSVGNYMEYTNYAKPAAMAPDSILIQHYIVDNSSFFISNKTNLDRTPAFVEKLSELYGLYPFKNEKYGHSQASIGGGMEHQTMTTLTSFGATLVAHELGHQWFGDNVTCARWNDIWINEGFASYSEYLMVEKLPAFFTSTPAAYMQSIHTDVLLSTTGSVYVPDVSLFDENRIFSSRFTYNKGSAIIHNLRFEMQDDNKFFQTLKTFQQQYKDNVATADDFKTVAETVCGRSFADFFNQWYYGQGYPTFNVDYSKPGDSIILRVNETVSAPAITPFFKGLYEFTINTVQGDTTVKVNLTANDQLFKFRSNRTPTGIVVDPNNWVLNKVGSITTATPDINVSNDVKLFPNPSAGTIYLQYPANWFDNLQVYDIAGKILQQKAINRGSTQQTINTSLLPGMYCIKLNGKGKVGVKKLVVVK
jgi:aminopeptidase N